MRVLVTGHQGYIGSVLTRVLTESAIDVIGLDAGYFETNVLTPTDDSIRSIGRDVRDVKEWQLEGINAIIHLCALSNDPLGALHPQATDEINHRGTLYLADLARRAGVTRFLFSSSCSVYGASSPTDILDESATFHPVTEYGRSKVDAEVGLAALADEHFSPVYLRNATAYGISPRLRADLVVNNLVGWAYLTREIRLTSDGTPWRPLVHVEDISRAILAALDAPRECIHNQAFNVGRDGENYQIRQIAELIQEAMPGTRLAFGPGAGPDPRCYRVNFGKIARTMSEFRPRWNLALGIQELLHAYQTYGLCLADFDGPKFQRIACIRQLMNNGRLDHVMRWTSTAEPVS